MQQTACCFPIKRKTQMIQLSPITCSTYHLKTIYRTPRVSFKCIRWKCKIAKALPRISPTPHPPSKQMPYHLHMQIIRTLFPIQRRTKERGLKLFLGILRGHRLSWKHMLPVRDPKHGSESQNDKISLIHPWSSIANEHVIKVSAWKRHPQISLFQLQMKNKTLMNSTSTASY